MGIDQVPLAVTLSQFFRPLERRSSSGHQQQVLAKGQELEARS